ncbi:MAG: hypothetical protein A3H51_00275 [Candidatus Spechtbacteria bacterium RIFCSPLOWO2_02_FULL_38_8]|uniref:Uncharacterized protein n=1 Tax=Candidatus Spechtbacteria bacterium RIFCSPLOWO2_02_FULL_38_8 TaxID=1802164 RepID=A0A1G2HH44_9BACT|nr:MAG: hypothetical protein A3H51_00275 [Candidatus Spechtbacteria bacterium RIFCSPLOWO2_02_FULL_38_8]
MAGFKSLFATLFIFVVAFFIAFLVNLFADPFVVVNTSPASGMYLFFVFVYIATVVFIPVAASKLFINFYANFTNRK